MRIPAATAHQSLGRAYFEYRVQMVKPDINSEIKAQGKEPEPLTYQRKSTTDIADELKIVGETIVADEMKTSNATDIADEIAIAGESEIDDETEVAVDIEEPELEDEDDPEVEANTVTVVNDPG